MRQLVFKLWENKELRNWSFTIGLWLVTVVGARFAWLAWQHGYAFDRLMVILAGPIMGSMAVIIPFRFWLVPPIHTEERLKPEANDDPKPTASKYPEAVAAAGARNWQIARVTVKSLAPEIRIF